ncbi:MAG: hypothetical protein HKN87_16985 [Saprospiraceae bacterium]|nr:hypothetical protein [Saprospiraceae bacterium]
MMKSNPAKVLVMYGVGRWEVSAPSDFASMSSWEGVYGGQSLARRDLEFCKVCKDVVDYSREKQHPFAAVFIG